MMKKYLTKQTIGLTLWIVCLLITSMVGLIHVKLPHLDHIDETLIGLTPVVVWPILCIDEKASERFLLIAGPLALFSTLSSFGIVIGYFFRRRKLARTVVIWFFAILTLPTFFFLLPSSLTKEVQEPETSVKVGRKIVISQWGFDVQYLYVETPLLPNLTLRKTIDSLPEEYNKVDIKVIDSKHIKYLNNGVEKTVEI